MVVKNKKNIWITWHYQTRTRNLAKELNLDLHELFIRDNLVKRHLFSSIWTIKKLFGIKPNVVFIQYSFLLLIITVLYKKVFRKHLSIIVDVHTKGLRRVLSGIAGSIFWFLKKWSFSQSDLVIISNQGLIPDVVKFNSNYMILPDKIVEYNIVKESKFIKPYCVNISSFAIDEPVDEIFELSNKLNDFRIYWTGKSPDNVKRKGEQYSNIIFTGYLSFEDYFALINEAEFVIVLTTEEDCLQSGAYEALGVNTPMVISDTKALNEFFGPSAVYTKHDPENLYKNIQYLIENKKTYLENILFVKQKRQREFQLKVKEVIDYAGL